MNIIKKLTGGGKKKEEAPPEVVEVYTGKKIFGGEFDGTTKKVPRVMSAIIGYFDIHGVKIEGLFRISGTLSEINQIIEEYNRGKIKKRDIINKRVNKTKYQSNYLYFIYKIGVLKYK